MWPHQIEILYQWYVVFAVIISTAVVTTAGSNYKVVPIKEVLLMSCSTLLKFAWEIFVILLIFYAATHTHISGFWPALLKTILFYAVYGSCALVLSKPLYSRIRVRVNSWEELLALILMDLFVPLFKTLVISGVGFLVFHYLLKMNLVTPWKWWILGGIYCWVLSGQPINKEVSGIKRALRASEGMPEYNELYKIKNRHISNLTYILSAWKSLASIRVFLPFASCLTTFGAVYSVSKLNWIAGETAQLIQSSLGIGLGISAIILLIALRRLRKRIAARTETALNDVGDYYKWDMERRKAGL